MFIDYYALLEILPTASQEEIKKAFKIQALKWHPDINKSPIANERTLLILEAYHILNDERARNRYNKTYNEFVAEQSSKINNVSKEESVDNNMEKQEESAYAYSGFDIKDDLLRSLIHQARMYAKEKSGVLIEELRGSVNSGIGTASGLLRILGGAYLKGYIIASIVIFAISVLKESCNH